MIAGVVLALLVASAVAAGRWPRQGAIALMAMSLLWLGNNQSMEGRLLLTVTSTRGIVAADLAGVLGLMAAGILLWRHRS